MYDEAIWILPSVLARSLLESNPENPNLDCFACPKRTVSQRQKRDCLLSLVSCLLSLVSCLWAGRDSNPRRPKSADLQSAAIDRSATYPLLLNLLFIPHSSHLSKFSLSSPFLPTLRVSRSESYVLSHLSDSDRRPTVYKTVALPTELRWPLRHLSYLLFLVSRLLSPYRLPDSIFSTRRIRKRARRLRGLSRNTCLKHSFASSNEPPSK